MTTSTPPRPADSAAELVTSSDGSATVTPKELRRRARAWAMYDVGNSGFQAVVVTFVFATYLASDYFLDPAVVAIGAANPQAPEYLAAQAASTATIANLDTLAAIVVAVLAPALGARSDGSGKRKRWLVIFSLITIALMLGMFAVFPSQPFLLIGASLLAIGVVFSELAGVNYDAMLGQVSTRKNVGRVSSMGWGLGYIGSIVLLVLLLVLFIQSFGVEGRTGLLQIPSGAAGEALNIRVAIVAAALWFAAFLLPIMRRVPELPRDETRARAPWWTTYRDLWRTIAALGRSNPRLLLFLFAAAVYRDGLNAIFSFGAILAAQVYGFSASQVIYFAVAANLVAGLGTLASGWFDDRFSPKAVVLTSLIALVATAGILFVLPGQPLYFWIFGLFLCLFVGPAQSASRSYLMRAAPQGHEGEVFGLYRTTGRAVSFFAPMLIAILATVSGDPKIAVVAIGIVLLLGLVLFLPVPAHPKHAVLHDGSVA